MPEVTVIETQPTPEPETAAAETTEAVAEAAVEIAQIEADRDVAIAEIHAETEQQTSEAIAASIENNVTEEREEWQRNIEARLSSQETTQAEILSTLKTLTDRLPPSQPENLVSPEAMPEKQEVPEPPPKPKAQHHRLI